MAAVADLPAIFLGAFLLALSGALMPGPLLTFVIADSAKRGAISGPLLILGHAILEFALVFGVIFGLGAFLKQHLVIGIVSLAGGCVLLWMGVSMVRTAGGLSLDMDVKSSVMKMNPVFMGFLGSISNPYWILWWATIGLGYLLSSLKAGYAGLLSFFIGHILADLIWYSVVAGAVSRSRTIMKQKHYQWAIRFCGVLLFLFGCWFLWTSYSYLN